MHTTTGECVATQIFGAALYYRRVTTDKRTAYKTISKGFMLVTTHRLASFSNVPNARNSLKDLLSACGPCLPKPPPVSPPADLFCPTDTLKLGVCVDLLGGLVNLVIGTPPSSKCCTLLAGLADLEAAVCLCTAIKANVLGINLDVPVALSLLISTCEKTIPPDFKCA
ncbi:hypothetical protein HHK36_025821 [Tetracentron sinense]|uniref:Bifunctional inhibitor/plant lipid transfer protein/seed storage helical domain-containing protein n=1 Tax=Tetracentron sinense TaxID=13715 RepID=A0A834YJH1_TETSI|nr:hypothetical protein HHK36_025821 [Tetracentron sinense]